jgi:hypothetical protein
LLQVNKTVGTLAAWYVGLVASNVFLDALQDEQVAAQQQHSVYDHQIQYFFQQSQCHVSSQTVAPFDSQLFQTFFINHLNNSLYTSRYPQYCMAEGIFLGKYSTGKFNLNNDTSDADWQALSTKLVKAATRMQEHGYFEPYLSSEKKKLGARCLGRLAVNIYASFTAKSCKTSILILQSVITTPTLLEFSGYDYICVFLLSHQRKITLA